MNPTHIGGRHLVICNWRDAAHPQAGGAELYCEEVARQLQQRGFTLTLVTSRFAGAPARQTVDFGTIVRLGGTFTTYPLVLLWLLVHRRQIDAVLDSENGIPYFAPLALRRRTPVVLLIHHVHQRQFEMYFSPIVARIGQWLERWGARFAYGARPVCAVSPSAERELRQQLCFRGPVVVVPNGVTISSSGADVARSAQPRIVCVGRLMPHKRYELLVRAIAELQAGWPTLQVHIVGDGERRAGLEREVAAAGLTGRFQFHGRLSQDQRDRLMATAWLTVSPSAGEGWGLSVMEAAAHGVPAVAFRVPGLSDSVRHGETGWLVDDVAHLGATIDEALSTLADARQATVWAEACRRWARKFTWQSTATRIHEVLVAEHDRLVGLSPDGWQDRASGLSDGDNWPAGSMPAIARER